MRVAELKSLTRKHGLRGYSLLGKAELIGLLQNNPPPQAALWRPPRPNRPPPLPPPLVRFRPDRPRQPSLQEMDIFEWQEMSTSWSQITSKLNDWYGWLIGHVSRSIKDGASREFKTFKDKIMGFFYWKSYST